MRTKTNEGLLYKFGTIKLLAVDFDGCLGSTEITVGVNVDATILSDGNSGQPLKWLETTTVSHRDGQGVDHLKKLGIPFVIISNQKSPYVEARATKMKVPFFVRVKDKPAKLLEFLRENHPNIKLSEVCYVGDDDSDRDILSIVGLPVAVANATDEIKEIVTGRAGYVCQKEGGHGAIREITDLIVRAKSDGIAPDFTRVLIMGTGSAARPEVCEAARELGEKLAHLGFTVITNGGNMGVPKEAGLGVAKAIQDGAKAISIGYTFMPNFRPEDSGTTELKYFGTYEERNYNLLNDADIGIFFQGGGVGTLAKLFTMLHRAVHINKNLAKNRLEGLQVEKLVIVHESLAPQDFEACQRVFGAGFKQEHFDAINFVSTVDEIIQLAQSHHDKRRKNG